MPALEEMASTIAQHIREAQIPAGRFHFALILVDSIDSRVTAVNNAQDSPIAIAHILMSWMLSDAVPTDVVLRAFKLERAMKVAAVTGQPVDMAELDD